MHNDNQPLSPTKTEMQEYIKQALANLSLEGMHPSKEMLNDIELWMTNKISEQEFISRGLKNGNTGNASR